jgi:hypothetical protein
MVRISTPFETAALNEVDFFRLPQPEAPALCRCHLSPLAHLHRCGGSTASGLHRPRLTRGNCGSARTTPGELRYFSTSLPDVKLVSSVPEPGSLTRAGSGVLALTATYRRQRMRR